MRKNFGFLLMIIVTHTNCNQRANTIDDHLSTQEKANSAEFSVSGQNQSGLKNLFILSDAEKILGEEAHLTDSTSANDKIFSYQSSYTSDSVDHKTGKLGTVYFMFEQYDNISMAKEGYSGIRTANANHGIRDLSGVGDEAYFHTDNQNFYFILVRKGEKMFRMKVNKITSATSLDQFNGVAERIAKDM